MMCLVACPPLPEPTASSRSPSAVTVNRIRSLRHTTVSPCAAAGEEDQEHAEEESDHGCETGPHCDAVEGVAA